MPGQKDRQAAVSRCGPLQRAWTSAAFLRRVAVSGRREERLATQRDLCGEHLTEADWRPVRHASAIRSGLCGTFQMQLATAR